MKLKVKDNQNKTFDSHILSEKNGKLKDRINVEIVMETTSYPKSLSPKLITFTAISERNSINKKLYKITDILSLKNDGIFEINI